jgi:uncharacterized cupin superfamily protein
MQTKIRPPALDPATMAPHIGLVPPIYPPPWNTIAAGRRKWQFSQALGLTDFGVNLVELPPGEKSCLRHWHSHEDEFIYVLSGELTLVTDEGEQRLAPGMVAGFPKATPNGHHLINSGSEPAQYLEVGSRHPNDVGTYSDVDLRFSEATGFTKKTGEP